MASFQDLTTTLLRQALQLREQIETLQQKLDALLGGSSSTVAKPKAGRQTAKKRTMSPEGWAKIAAAQKARWAAKKGTPARATKPVAKKKKRVLSEEGRARIVAATKARWAAKKSAATAE